VTQVIEFNIRECSCANQPTPDCSHDGQKDLGVIAAFSAKVISQNGASCTAASPCDNLAAAITKLNDEYTTYMSNRADTVKLYVDASAERQRARRAQALARTTRRSLLHAETIEIAQVTASQGHMIHSPNILADG